MLKVKIDGIREVRDALTAAEAGADFIGMVFVPNGRRRASLERARQVVDAVKSTGDTSPKLVGLFADQPLEEVIETVHDLHLDVIQLCGDESLGFCDKAPVPIFKAIHIRGGHLGPGVFPDLRLRLRVLRERGHAVTLDRMVTGYRGGTGTKFDWEIATKLAEEGLEFMLAGGLTPENVKQAVREVKPWGLDVSSGVETRGVKDAEKIRRFVFEVKNAEA